MLPVKYVPDVAMEVMPISKEVTATAGTEFSG
jgi:hypothetical protein